MIIWFKDLYKWRELTTTLAKIDLKLRYRRSFLGGWWNLITLLITMGALGFIWSNIFKTDLKEYLPYFASGYIFWNFITALINEGANAFIASESLIRQSKVPLQVYVVRIILKNLIILAINCTVLILIFIILNIHITIYGMLMSIVGLLLGLLLITPAVLTLAIACARFRDLPQVIANVMQLMFFVTPIMWKRELLSADYQWIAEWNPLLLVLDVIRGPLLSIQPSLEEYMFLVGAIIFVSSVGGVVFRRYKKQLPFWA